MIKKQDSKEQQVSIEQLGEIVSRFAHDFNNLLVGIEGNARLIKEEGLLLPQGEPLMTQLIDCAIRASALTQEMHDKYGSEDDGTFRLNQLRRSGFDEDDFELDGDFMSKNTILVIDDEEIVRSVSEAILLRAGYDVLLAGSGEEGITTFEENRDLILCVLLDLTMPYMKGNLVFARLKAIDPQVRVFLISGYSDRQAMEQFDTEGIIGFIQKPFNSEKLLSAIASTKKVRRARAVNE